MPHSGSCKCGAVKFEVGAEPIWSGYCHCKDCRKATGAPVSTFVIFKSKDVKWLGEAPRTYTSSEHVRRSFCPNCGSPISYWHDRWPDDTDFYVGLFDAPEAFIPKVHIWYPQRLPWLHLEDQLPKLEQGDDSFDA